LTRCEREKLWRRARPGQALFTHTALGVSSTAGSVSGSKVSWHPLGTRSTGSESTHHMTTSSLTGRRVRQCQALFTHTVLGVSSTVGANNPVRGLVAPSGHTHHSKRDSTHHLTTSNLTERRVRPCQALFNHTALGVSSTVGVDKCHSQERPYEREWLNT
jgi:hypothetical protein